MSQTYRPPFGLRNPHLQNILSSTGPRRWLIQYRTRRLKHDAEEMLLDCGDGVRLLGFLNRHPTPSSSLVTLFHGWEGSSESTYVLSLAERLFHEGHDVFRLNFRDHGNTTHLNQALFNSTRLSDVTGALNALQAKLSYRHYGLAGFSLGGNFALRVALSQPQQRYRIDHTVAVCPVICPADTMEALATGQRFYEHHFVTQWKRSLLAKARHFPEYRYQTALRKLRTLKAINDLFIPGYTPFEDAASYFDAYQLKGERLQALRIPATIITSEDDPIVRHHMLPQNVPNPHLTVLRTRHGAHCAYLKNYRLHSWTDDRIADTLRPFLQSGTTGIE